MERRTPMPAALLMASLAAIAAPQGFGAFQSTGRSTGRPRLGHYIERVIWPAQLVEIAAQERHNHDLAHYFGGEYLKTYNARKEGRHNHPGPSFEGVA